MFALRNIINRALDLAWRRWRDEVTPAGKYLLGGVSLAIFGLITVQIPIYQVLFALAALLAVAEVAGVIFSPRVKVAGEFPLKATAGQPVVGHFTVANQSWRPTYDLELGLFGLPAAIREVDAGGSVPCLKQGESVTLPVTLAPVRRGLHELPPLRVFSTFPFNLVRSGWSRLPLEPLLVLPAFHPLARVDIPVGSRYQPGGIALTSHVGESPEYVGNREYIPGEPVRRLDFRAWARLGIPVVREFQEEYYCRIALILDTFIPPRRRGRWSKPLRPGPEGFPELEAAVSLTAAVADALSSGEYLVDLFAAGPELYVFHSGRHTAHFENMLEILACVEACREDPFQNILPALADEVGNISAAVCILLDWDGPRRQLVRTILEAGCSLKVVIVRDGDTTEPLTHEDGGEFVQIPPASIRDGGVDSL
jgi:uncharacterized protein (DUF58 family)